MALFVLFCFLKTVPFLLSTALFNISIHDHSLQYRYHWKFHRIIYSYIVLAPSLQYSQFINSLSFETVRSSLANSQRVTAPPVSTTIEEAVGVTSSLDSSPAQDSTRYPKTYNPVQGKPTRPSKNNFTNTFQAPEEHNHGS